MGHGKLTAWGGINLPLLLKGDTLEEGNEQANYVRQRHDNIGGFDHPSHPVNASTVEKTVSNLDMASTFGARPPR
jgi:hypothetical protein